MITPYTHLTNVPDIEPLLEKDNDFIYSLCDNTLFTMKNILDSYGENLMEFTKNEATVLGLYAKQYYLFNSFVASCKDNRDYECTIFQRIIYEAFIKMSYLISHGEEEQKSYRRYSYKARYDAYKKDSSTEGIMGVRNRKFLEDLADDGFNTNDIQKSKAFGGKNLRQLIEDVEGGTNELYNALYAIPSDSIHSDWGDIRQLYIQKVPTKGYVCYLDHERKIHYRYIIGMVSLMIDSTYCYHHWLQNIDKANTTTQVMLELIQELERIAKLVSSVVINNFKNNPDKYMYE